MSSRPLNHLRRLFFRLVSFFRSGRAEAELAREIDAHLQLLEDQFVAQGMSGDEARFAARRAFGGQVEQTKVRQRDVRSFRFLDESWLDLKLGARMLVKTPGLTAVAVFALSVAIASGAAYMEFLRDLTRPTLPIRDGNRIVGIYNWDAARGEADHRSLHDFAVWRDALVSVEEVGAYTVLERNLITDDGRVELVSGVEISPAAFRLMSTPPLVGRPLVEHDAQPGAPPVVVLGEALWEARFGRDSAMVGQTIRLGRERHTVVGVMPRSFGFPVNQNLWVPLRVTGADVRRGEGPSIRVFGRLGPGASLDDAQAEIQAVSSRNRTDAQSNQLVRPQIQPWVTSLWSSATDGQLQLVVLYSANLFFIALLGVCGANVATLVFGRTALRESEITVRTALGASRGRIIGQLFAEALVLAAVAAVVGVAGASFAVSWGTARWLEGTAGGAQAPFWLNDQLSPETLLYAGALALLAAIIVGVIPGLKATGPEMARLRHAAAGGATMKFGGVWTGIIVGQVALTVLFLLSAVSLGWNLYATYQCDDSSFGWPPSFAPVEQTPIWRARSRRICSCSKTSSSLGA